ncbi:MAG: DUF1828 domain-containing protein [Candidatus Peribacteria bacterium]|jgi:hypothetical protein|nr:DUF1828 domain-containing protein [Candidatus Peribacteria bacterium]
MMRLSYDTDIDSETRKSIFDKILASYNVEFDDKNGQFFTLVENLDALFASISEFIMVISKVSDISYLREERMKNMFYKIFDMFVDEKLNNLDIQKEFQFSFDKKGDYRAPYVFFSEKKTPIILVPVLNSEKCIEYISSYWFYISHNEKIRTIAQFYDVEEISNKVRGKFLDIIDKPFSNFGSNKENLVSYTNEIRSIF